jgi:hypothetical protein
LGVPALKCSAVGLSAVVLPLAEPRGAGYLLLSLTRASVFGIPRHSLGYLPRE